jgi:hypothetical protein
MGERTTHDRVILNWGPYSKTVRLDKHTNVATFNLAPGYNEFNAYCTTIEHDDETAAQLVANPAQLGDEEGKKRDDDQSVHDSNTESDDKRPWVANTKTKAPNTKEDYVPRDFDLNGPTEGEQPDVEDPGQLDSEAIASASRLRTHVL